jgi:hypothetical protein
MSDHIVCPHCGKHLAKGSTFCMNCGNRVPENLRTLTTSADSLAWEEPHTTSSSQPESTSIPDETITLPDPDALDLTPPSPPPSSSESPEEEIAELPPVELSWDDVEASVESQKSTPEAKSPPIEDTLAGKETELIWDEVERPAKTPKPTLEMTTPSLGTPPLRPIDDKIRIIDSEEAPMADSEEGFPFKEIEPPKVVDEMATTTDEATTHLFPEGRSDTTPDFIDAVVGEAEKITISTPMPELESPSCPSCGAVLTGDDFEYPAYVYSAMGKARFDHGIELLDSNQPQEAIEAFEKAKKLFERAEDEKMIEISIRKIDEGYDAMGHSHFALGEKHLRDGEFEWAIVQFRKAREIYMLSTDKKLRAKCAEKIRVCYLVWGKSLEDEADRLAKEGDVRTALERYKQAAEKYRDGGDDKRLKGLEKKIRKA